MSSSEIIIILCTFGALLLGAWSYHQSKAPPQVDLREKLKNLAKDPEAMAREIELGTDRQPIFEVINFRPFFAKFTGQT